MGKLGVFRKVCQNKYLILLQFVQQKSEVVFNIFIVILIRCSACFLFLSILTRSGKRIRNIECLLKPKCKLSVLDILDIANDICVIFKDVTILDVRLFLYFSNISNNFRFFKKKSNFYALH